MAKSVGDLDVFRARAEQTMASGRIKPLAIEQWQPLNRVYVDLRIAADGEWLYRGQPIQRPELIRLFASILRREPDGYYLVTPHEKAKIQVDDAPLLVVDATLSMEEPDSQSLTVDGEPLPLIAMQVITNTETEFSITPEHPIVSLSEWSRRTGQAPPSGSNRDNALYVLLDRGLSARVSRGVFYRLSDFVTLSRDGQPGLMIANQWYPL